MCGTWNASVAPAPLREPWGCPWAPVARLSPEPRWPASPPPEALHQAAGGVGRSPLLGWGQGDRLSPCPGDPPVCPGRQDQPPGRRLRAPASCACCHRGRPRGNGAAPGVAGAPFPCHSQAVQLRPAGVGKLLRAVILVKGSPLSIKLGQEGVTAPRYRQHSSSLEPGTAKYRAGMQTTLCATLRGRCCMRPVVSVAVPALQCAHGRCWCAV